MLSAASMAAYAQNTPSGAPAGSKDYFTQQPADTPLVIRMDAFETEFESRVFDPKNILLKASGLSGQRLGAVYQFIEASAKPRQLRIEVNLGHGTDRSKLDMQVTRFEPDGPDKRAVMQAYRLLSTGLELPASERADEWTLKVITLMQAGNLFNDLGMQEMYLWSAFYAHHYLLAFLDDPVTAAEGGREIYAGATRSRLGDLALATLQLQGSATAAQAAGKAKPIADSLFDQAQDLFRQAAELAAQMDYQHERASAIYHSGLAFEAAGDTGRAFAQFDQAIDIATGCGDAAFANQIRQHAAELHESLGDNAEAITMMQQISAESPAGNALADAEPQDIASPEDAVAADGELVNYLLEQGRLLEKTYRHTEAAEVLRQALELNQKSASPSLSGPMALLLAKSLYGAGQFDAALKYLLEGIKKTPSFRHEDALYEAYGILAAIQRFRGDFAAMSAARERQQLFLGTPGAQAGFTFETALDRLAAEGRNSASAVTLLRQSEQEARASGAKILQQLAALRLCAVGEPCASAVAQDAQNAVRASGLPVPSLEARLLWAEILRREGQRSRAASELDGLIEDMRYFHSDLPGVLGAWYWQNREAVFSSFMELTLGELGSSSESGPLGVLVSLDRIMRYAREQAAGAVAASQDPESERLRSLIAAREAGESGQDTTSLAARIRKKSQNWSTGQEAPGRSLSRVLERLTGDAALLTFYFTPKKVYAWIGRNDGLKLVQIPWSADQSAALSEVAEGLRWDSANGRTAEFPEKMDQLGQRLLAPVAKLLPQVIYFFPSGRLEGFPLDALRWNGEYLAARHKVINLLSLDDLSSRETRVEPDDLQRFFLAGNRQEGAGDFQQLKPPSAELNEIADMFVGPGLHIVQGAALQWDEFQDERFELAGVVHLAMPGTIDLRDPERSQLMLSDNTSDPAHAFLQPHDIESMKLGAALVVLSACDFTGTNPSAFDQNTRFINEFLYAGAGAVMASLWNVGDLQAARFMQRFYQQLISTRNASAALFATKQTYLAQNENPDNEAWAAFQLFTR
jgi:CHAT domain-containing protein